MIQIELVCIGKIQFDYLSKGIEDYSKRINHFCKFNIHILPEIKGKMEISELKLKEEKLFEQYLKNKSGKIILLDEKGKTWTSRQFADWLDIEQNNGSKSIIFLIGGAYGFTDKMKKEADIILSFSALTYSHQLIRLIFTEQLYRIFTILKNIPYHNE